MALIEEPLSGAFLPERLELENGETTSLLCCGLRSKRIGFVDVQVYALGVYGDPEAVFGRGGATDDPENVLFESKADKVFSLTLLRNVTGAQIAEGLGETLVKMAGVPKSEVDMITPFFPARIDKGGEVRMTVRPSASEIIIGADATSKVEVPEVIRGLHELYFGPNAVVKGLKESLQRQQPWLEALPDPEMGVETGISFNAPVFESTAQNQIVSCLPDISSENELEDASTSNTPIATSPQKSWKASSGRAYGKEGYKLGDLTRTLVLKGRHRIRGDSGGGQIESSPEAWPGALVVENSGEAPSWVAVQDVPCLDGDALAAQSLEAVFHKYHNTPLRGRLVPKWSLRFYELKAGSLKYRRKEGGKIVGSVSLDGARVVAEPVKASRFGDCFVFRIILDTEIVARLSSTDQSVAREWVLAVSAACTYYQDHVRTPPVQECEALPENSATTKESSQGAAKRDLEPALAKQQDMRAITTAREQMATAPARSSEFLQQAVAALFGRSQKSERRACMTMLVSLLLVLFAGRRLRRRALAYR